MTTADIIKRYRTKLSSFPRANLAHLPTPLDDCPRLSAHLGGPHIWIKRDDCTGLAFGGNKVRQHEYVLGAALAAGADCLIQGSASQSNHSRQLAAAGAKLGLPTFLVPKMDSWSSPLQGNYLVDHLLGATVSPINPNDSAVGAKDALAARLRKEGRNPYITGMGADESLVLAALAYVDALFEVVEQFPLDEAIDWIYTASQGSTQAGLLVGCEILGIPTKILGVHPMGVEHEAFISPAGVLELAIQCAALLGVESRLTIADVLTTDDFIGEGYGKPTQGAKDAIRLLGSREGILLDPVYTAKAFAALVAHCEDGTLGSGQNVVFVHTGGLPALFAYAHQFVMDFENE